MFFQKQNQLYEIRRDIEKEEERWKAEKPLLERKINLQNEKQQFMQKKKKISTSKLLILFLFINCTLIELFTGWAMIKMLSIASMTGLGIDFTPLVALIGAVVGEVIGYGIYSIKSTKENLQGGIVYDTAMKNLDNNTPVG